MDASGMQRLALIVVVAAAVWLAQAPMAAWSQGWQTDSADSKSPANTTVVPRTTLP
jgi:hypothetical protein